jgi:hypothetical protein
MMEVMILFIQGIFMFMMTYDRAIMAGVTKHQWPPYVSEVFRILKPGTGWIMCCEFNPNLKCDDDSVSPDSAIFRVLPCSQLINPSSKDTFMISLKFRKIAC